MANVNVVLRAGSNNVPQNLSAEDRDTVDWSKITNKPSVLPGAGLSGGGKLSSDVTLGLTPGSIPNGSLASAPAYTLKGNNTGVIAPLSDLTGGQAVALLPAFTGDTGTGGVKGLVPAPAAGDTAAGKFLGANGQFVTVASVAGATQAEAEAGVSNAVVMTPLRTKQAVLSQVGFIDVNGLSDGSGTAANDDAAVAAALAAAAADPTKTVLFTRAFKLLSEKTISSAMRLEFSGKNAKLLPQTAMRSVLNITAGRVTVRGIYGENSAFSNATSLIRVSKGWDNLPVIIENLEATGFTNVVDWDDGDVPQFWNFRCVNNTTTLRFRNNGMNGQIGQISALGGQGLVIARNAAATQPQQMEGTHFYGLNILPGDKVNGVNTGNVIDIQCGLALRFYGLLVDQVYHNSAVYIQGTAPVPVNDIQIYGLWCGTHVSRDAANVHGLNLQGAAQSVKVYGGQVYGFSGYGVLAGGTAALTVSDLLLQGVDFASNGGSDLYAAYANGTLIGNKFGTTTPGKGVYEITNTEFIGFNNYFGVGPQAIGALSQYYASRGPGSIRGFPTSSTGLTSGKLWIDSAAGNVLKVV